MTRKAKILSLFGDVAEGQNDASLIPVIVEDFSTDEIFADMSEAFDD